MIFACWSLSIVALLLAILGVLTRYVPNQKVSWDYTVLVTINGFAAHAPLLLAQDRLFSVNFSELLTVFGIVWLWSSGRFKEFDERVLRHRALLLLATCLPTYALLRMLQYFSHRQRPFFHVPLTPLVDATTWAQVRQNSSHWGSFPSDHAALSAIVTVVAFSISIRIGWASLVLALYGSLYRIATGYHWPTDIAAGALVGLVTATVALNVEPRVRPFFDKILKFVSRHPGPAYVGAFLLLSELGDGFARIQVIVHGLGARLFH